jgi:hypothetical protein
VLRFLRDLSLPALITTLMPPAAAVAFADDPSSALVKQFAPEISQVLAKASGILLTVAAR